MAILPPLRRLWGLRSKMARHPQVQNANFTLEKSAKKVHCRACIFWLRQKIQRSYFFKKIKLK